MIIIVFILIITSTNSKLTYLFMFIHVINIFQTLAFIAKVIPVVNSRVDS